MRVLPRIEEPLLALAEGAAEDAAEAEAEADSMLEDSAAEELAANSLTELVLNVAAGEDRAGPDELPPAGDGAEDLDADEVGVGDGCGGPEALLPLGEGADEPELDAAASVTAVADDDASEG